MASEPVQQPRNPGRRRRAFVLAAALLGLLGGVALLPPGGLPGDAAGDPRLAQLAREEFDDPGVHALAIAVVQPDPARGASRVRTATIGAPLGARWEVGSFSKAVTGLLYADALERGEIEPGTTLGDHLDLGGAPAAAITLESLTQHRSGLPRLPGGAGTLWRALTSLVTAGNPYPDDLADLTAQLRDAEPGDRDPAYSNFGFEALGAALAAAAGTPYPELVRERIARPLGLGLVIPADPQSLPPGSVQGRDRAGRRHEAWAGEALAPAGGIRASAADIGRLLAAILDGRAPGTDALEPVSTFRAADGDDPARQIGAAWFTTEEDGRTLTFHNGATGGFRSWAGVDRAAGVGLAVMASTSDDDVWDDAQELLAELGRGEVR